MSSEISDKRREVARRLREYPVHLALGMEGGSLIRALAMLSGLLNATGLRQDDPAWLYGRLADLIDPTCHRVVEDETQVCSECGEDLDEGYGWEFCPSCGRRVVDGGGEDA